MLGLDQLLSDAARARRTSGSPADARSRAPRRLAAALAGERRHGARCPSFILQSQDSGARLRLCARARSSSRSSCNLIRISHRDERAGLIAALVLVVADDFLLHLLSADVHVAQSVRAEQREPRFQAVRLALVHLDSRAIPESQLDLDRGAESRAGLHLQLAWPRRQGSRDRREVRAGASRRSRSASSSTAWARAGPSTARCPPGSWSGGTVFIRSASCS